MRRCRTKYSLNVRGHFCTYMKALQNPLGHSFSLSCFERLRKAVRVKKRHHFLANLKIKRQEKCTTDFLVIVTYYRRKLRSFENFAKIYARYPELLSFKKRITQNLSSRRKTSSSK